MHAASPVLPAAACLHVVQLVRVLSLVVVVTSTAARAEQPLAAPLPSPWRFLEREPGKFMYPGGPVPDGFRLVARPRWGLVAPGATLLAVSMATSAAFPRAQFGALMVIPLVGPALGFGSLVGGGFGFQGFITLLGYLYLSQLGLQVVSIVMLIAGFAMPIRTLQRTSSPRIEVSVVPGAGSAPAGASIVGRF